MMCIYAVMEWALFIWWGCRNIGGHRIFDSFEKFLHPSVEGWKPPSAPRVFRAKSDLKNYQTCDYGGKLLKKSPAAHFFFYLISHINVLCPFLRHFNKLLVFYTL